MLSRRMNENENDSETAEERVRTSEDKKSDWYYLNDRTLKGDLDHFLFRLF